MIYILAYDDYVCFKDGCEIGESIFITSTKIEDLLAYLDNNVIIDLLRDYVIICMEENIPYVYCEIKVGLAAYDMFVNYPHVIFLKEHNKSEFKHVSSVLQNWCNKKTEEKQRLTEERKQKEKEDNEKKERELYEKLKAKYGSE